MANTAMKTMIVLMMVSFAGLAVSIPDAIVADDAVNTPSEVFDLTIEESGDALLTAELQHSDTGHTVCKSLHKVRMNSSQRRSHRLAKSSWRRRLSRHRVLKFWTNIGKTFGFAYRPAKKHIQRYLDSLTKWEYTKLWARVRMWSAFALVGFIAHSIGAGGLLLVGAVTSTELWDRKKVRAGLWTSLTSVSQWLRAQSKRMTNALLSNQQRATMRELHTVTDLYQVALADEKLATGRRKMVQMCYAHKDVHPFENLEDDPRPITTEEDFKAYTLIEKEAVVSREGAHLRLNELIIEAHFDNNLIQVVDTQGRSLKDVFPEFATDSNAGLLQLDPSQWTFSFEHEFKMLNRNGVGSDKLFDIIRASIRAEFIKAGKEAAFGSGKLKFTVKTDDSLHSPVRAEGTHISEMS